MQEPIRVLLVNASPGLGDALLRYLASEPVCRSAVGQTRVGPVERIPLHLEIVAEAQGAMETVQAWERECPDMALIDVRKTQQGTGPARIVRTLRAAFPGAPILLLTGSYLTSAADAVMADAEPSAEAIEAVRALAGQIRLTARSAYETRAREHEVVQGERGRMARELHDTVMQALSAILIHAQAATEILPQQPDAALSHLSLVEGLVREGLDEIHRVVRALRSADLDKGGLSHALRRLLNRFAEGRSVNVLYQEQGASFLTCPDIESELLRIAQEALTNAQRHGDACNTVITLACAAPSLTLLIRDDGCGFDLLQAAASASRAREEGTGGFGLIGMQERAARIGGTLIIESAPGRGTLICVTVPDASIPTPTAHPVPEKDALPGSFSLSAGDFYAHSAS